MISEQCKVKDGESNILTYHLSLLTYHFKVKRGFTLIEILVVLTIIGILTSIGTVAYNNTLDKGRDNRRKQDLASIKAALTMYFEDNHYYYPPECTSPPCTDAEYPSDSGDDWIPDLASYIKQLPKDPRQAGIFGSLAGLFGKKGAPEPAQPQVAGTATIAFDAMTRNYALDTSSLTLSSHTVSGTNRVLLVGVSIPGNRAVNSITYNGVSLTKINSASTGSLSSDARMELWQLVAPDTGTHNIVITLNGSANVLIGGATSWTGVDQSIPFGTFASATGNGTAASINVTSGTDELVVDSLAVSDPITGPFFASQDSGQTWRWDYGYGNSGQRWGSGSSKPGATTTTMSWTINSSHKWAIGAIPLKPAYVPCASPVFDTVSTEDDENVPSLSWNHTVGTGSDRALLVGVSFRSGQTLNQLRLNGEPMGIFLSSVNVGGGIRVSMGLEVDPPTGVNTIEAIFRQARPVGQEFTKLPLGQLLKQHKELAQTPP